jgi:hypothetical protein
MTLLVVQEAGKGFFFQINVVGTSRSDFCLKPFKEV